MLLLIPSGGRTMEFDCSALRCTLTEKPLLVVGKALEYYRVRKAGADSNFIVSAVDFERLSRAHPGASKVRFGKPSVRIGDLEFWRSLVRYDYDFLSLRAVEEAQYKVASVEMLTFLWESFCAGVEGDGRTTMSRDVATKLA
jgi:hypothetical protein